MRWLELPTDGFVPPESEHFRVRVSGPVRTITSRDAGRWHLSVSCEDRYPTWDEIAEARYDLLPDRLEMAMILPPRDHYVNLHPYTFHLWEMRDPGMPIERHPTGMARSAR